MAFLIPNHMKKHFELVGDVDLSAVLALQATTPFDSIIADGYKDASWFVHVLSPTVRGLAARSSAPMLFTTHQGDHLTLSRGPGPWLREFNALLCLLGANLRHVGTEGAQLLRLDQDEFLFRISEIDALYVVHRAINRSTPDAAKWPAQTAMVLDAAAAWSRLRHLRHEQRDTAERAAQAVFMASNLSRERLGITGISDITVVEDPRGNSLSIHLTDRPWPLEVPAIYLNWSVGDTQSAPEEACKPSSPAPKTAKREKATSGVRPTKVDTAVVNVLRGATVKGHDVSLHDRLDPRLYAKVKALLSSLGGRWHTGRQAHVFDDDPGPVIEAICSTGTVATDKDYEFFWSPPDLVERMLLEVELAPGMKVREPSAGDGRIAMRAAQVVGFGSVICHELMPRNVRALQRAGFAIEQPEDFLKVPQVPDTDVVLMNPPFSGSKDITHLQHALGFLKPGGRLCAITSTNWQTQDTARNLAFRAQLNELGAKVQEIAPGTFADAGTNVPTLMITVRLPVAPTSAHSARHSQEDYDACPVQ